MRTELSGFIREACTAEVSRVLCQEEPGLDLIDYGRVADEVLERMDELTMACSHEVSPVELALYEEVSNG